MDLKAGDYVLAESRNGNYLGVLKIKGDLGDGWETERVVGFYSWYPHKYKNCRTSPYGVRHIVTLAPNLVKLLWVGEV